MAEQPKTVCLYSADHFLTLHVTPEPTPEEVQNINIRRTSFPQHYLRSLGPTTETRSGTSFVSVDSHIYCIACPEIGANLSNVVKRFDPEAAVLNFDSSFPRMKEERMFPAGAAIGGVIYVFGGTYEGTIWAECLDTKKPKSQQEWVALENPPRIHSLERLMFAAPCADNRILIFGPNISEDSLIYNVNDHSWTQQKFLDLPHCNWPEMSLPIFVEHDNALYWLYGTELSAFDLVSKEYTCGQVVNSVLEVIYEDSAIDKVFMHLEDNVFCVFTIYFKAHWTNGILECTKFRVNKRAGSLEIEVIGYQSYDADGMYTLFGGVFMKRESKNRRNKWNEPLGARCRRMGSQDLTCWSGPPKPNSSIIRAPDWPCQVLN